MIDLIAEQIILSHAEYLGDQAGRGVATWKDTFPDEDTARHCIALDNDGDPRWDDLFAYEGPAPLSGEYADDPTPDSIAEELQYDPEDYCFLHDSVMSAYETGFFDGWRAHLLDHAMTHVAFYVFSQLTDGKEVTEYDRSIAKDYVDGGNNWTPLAKQLRNLGIQ
jgi:hypothetical protein